MIPVLETERLLLRAPEPRDVAPFSAFFGTDAARFVGGPSEPALAWRSLAATIGCWTLRGYGEFAVEEKSTGEFVGLVGPWFPEGWPEPEMAWIVLPAHQRKGYGAEAAVRALRFAYEELGWETAISCIVDDNLPSQALARRLGAQREGMARFAPHGEMPVWRHLPAVEFFEHIERQAA